jgi:hypothetical protein
MFGQVLDKLATWLGPSFLLSRFFPWLVFCAANVMMVYAAFPAARPTIDRYVAGEPGDKIIVILVFLSAIAVAAYLTAPLLQAMLESLEGRYFPSWLAEALTIKHADRLARLEHAQNELLSERQKLRIFCPQAEDKLQSAREVGIKLGYNLLPDKIERATQSVKELAQKRRCNQLIKQEELNTAVLCLSDALTYNCADKEFLKPPAIGDNVHRSQRLEEVFKLITGQLLQYAIRIVSQKHAMAFLNRERLFALAELAPTRLGNDAAALRSYCDTRYGFDFDFFWPRLQLALQKDEKRSTSIVNAKVHLDFSVLLLWLTAFFTGSWLLLLGGLGNSLVLLLIVAGMGPLLTALWFGIVQTSYSSFTDIVRSTVDLNRFDLLTALHRPLPISTQAEKRVWDGATGLLMFNDASDTPFRQP